MNILFNIGLSLLAAAASFVGIYKFAPLSLLDNSPERNLGSAITTILGTDTLSSSRSVINANFAALNLGKFELSDWYATTSKTNLVAVGTLTTGTWNATTIGTPYGGTSSTTLALNQILFGNGTSGMKVIGYGTSGQFLTSAGNGLAPSWTTASIDQALDYAWTGIHTWLGSGKIGIGTSTPYAALSVVSSTPAVFGTIFATSTAATNATSTFSGNVVIGNNASTTNIIVSGAAYVGVLATTSASTAGPTGPTGLVEKDVFCPSGMSATGGGVVQASGDFTNTKILESYPLNTTTWRGGIYCFNGGGCGANTFTVHAMCSRLQ